MTTPTAAPKTEDRVLLLARVLVTVALLGLAYEVKERMEGVTGAIVAVVGQHWLPSALASAPEALRRS